jgi:hypothetical protein
MARPSAEGADPAASGLRPQCKAGLWPFWRTAGRPKLGAVSAAAGQSLRAAAGGERERPFVR